MSDEITWAKTLPIELSQVSLWITCLSLVLALLNSDPLTVLLNLR